MYLIFPWIDIPVHFLGGAAIGYSFILLLRHIQTFNLINEINFIIKIIFVFTLVITSAVIWEFSADYLLLL
jgi:hypothetical protein